VLELDEMWSCVRKQDQAWWVWTTMCRGTRHFVAFAIVDQGKATRFQEWLAIPHAYNHCHPFSDVGKPLNTCSQLKPIMVLGRKVGRLRRWNAGTTPCVN
jgi:hypothetical protein